MTNFIEEIWNLLNSINDDSIKIDNSKKDEFTKCFDKYRKYILKHYMSENTRELDRHKNAGIIVVSLIEANVILPCVNIPKDKVFLGDKIYALTVALSYMLFDLNETLKNKNLKSVDKYFFPQSFSCENNFFDVMARNLYYNEENHILDNMVLDLANVFFLIEYITIIKEGIDPIQLIYTN